MATGPEHYRAAQELLHDSRGITADDLEPAQLLTAVLAEAQVHATLALAAATWFADPTEGATGMAKEWWAVAGEPGSSTPGSSAEAAMVWWVDDGHENPGKPPLFTHAAAARDFAIKRFESDNPFTDTAGVVDWLVQPEDGDSSEDVELVVLGRRTGIIVRPIQPKAVVGA